MTTQNLITCPQCGHQFSLSDVQKHELEEMREKMKVEVEADMKKRAFAWAQEEVKKAEQKAKEENQKQVIELESLRKRDEEARKKETEFLRQSQEFENMKKNQAFELEKAKMEERKKVEEEAKKQAEERAKFEWEKMKLDYEKRMAEMQKQLEMTQKAVEDANRKANQWSMQIQGEIQEDALKELLIHNFPIDTISDVEKGKKWADVIQEVRNEFGQTVGIIAWESKNTKAWTEGWIDKLKEDRLRANADISILVTAVLPKDMEKFWLYKGIWVVEWSYALPVAIMLRAQIESMANLKNSLVSKDEKMELLYNYLTSPKFKDKVENIIDAFKQMKDQVEEERRAFEKRWKTREQLLEQVIKNTSGMYGDLGGVVGAKLGRVEYLELESGEI
jgi:hypothetical protein